MQWSPYITFLITILFAVAGIFTNILTPYIYSAIFFSLSLFAIRDILENRQLAFRHEKPTLDEVGIEDILPNRICSRASNIEAYLADADDVLVMGISLNAIVNDKKGWIEDRLSRGCKFRFLLPANIEDINRIGHLADNDEIQNASGDLKKAISGIISLAKQFKPTNGSPPKIDLKMIDFIPNMGITIINSAKCNGNVRVELYPYASPVDRRPTIVLCPIKSNDCLYSYMKDRYEALWNISLRHPELDLIYREN